MWWQLPQSLWKGLSCKGTGSVSTDPVLSVTGNRAIICIILRGGGVIVSLPHQKVFPDPTMMEGKAVSDSLMLPLVSFRKEKSWG